MMKLQAMVIPDILNVSRTIREESLETVYKAMSKQLDQWSDTVGAYNEKMKETLEQSLELYQQRVDAELETRMKVLEQKKKECAAANEVSTQEAETKAANMITLSDAANKIRQ